MMPTKYRPIWFLATRFMVLLTKESNRMITSAIFEDENIVEIDLIEKHDEPHLLGLMGWVVKAIKPRKKH